MRTKYLLITLFTLTMVKNANSQNLITNSDFNNGLTGWQVGHYGGNSVASIDSSYLLSGEYCAELQLTSTGTSAYTNQFVQTFSFTQGKYYKINFLAKAKTPKQCEFVVQQSCCAYATYFSQSFVMDTVKTSYGPYTYYAGVSNSCFAGFWFGGLDNVLTNIYFDSVVVYQYNTGPVATILVPGNGSQLTSGNINFTVEATHTSGNNKLIKQISLYDSSVFITNITTPDSIGYYSLKGASNGTHKYILVVTDSLGLTSTSTINVYVSYPTSLSSVTETSQPNIVFPNPVYDVANFSFSGDLAANKTLKITNTVGQTLIDKTISSNTLQIDFSGYPSGIYIATVNNKSFRFVKK